MNGPGASLPLAAPAPQSSRAGIVVSALCFLHCAGAAALAPLLPVTLAFLAESELVEWGLLGVSAVITLRASVLARRFVPVALPVGGFATMVGITGILLEREWLVQVGLGLLAVTQLWLMWKRSRFARSA